MNEQAPVLWHAEDGVGHIVLNRPEAVNALDAACSAALCEAVARAEEAAQARRGGVGAIVLSARGKQFCAGGDIHEFVAQQEAFAVRLQGALDRLHPVVHTLASLPVPVISAVQGPVGGAGISLALCADFVLAAPAMKLRGGYSAIGLTPDLGASYHLARRAGAARAKYILMTNRALSAEDCLRWGLVDELHADDALLPAAAALARQLAQGATQSFGAIKRLCDSAFEHDLRTHLALERETLLRAAVSAENREGMRAFVEKRAPDFSALPNN